MAEKKQRVGQKSKSGDGYRSKRGGSNKEKSQEQEQAVDPKSVFGKKKNHKNILFGVNIND